MPVRQAPQQATGSGMTLDAALVTLDFTLRRGLLKPALADLLALFACRPARPAASQYKAKASASAA